MEEKTKSGSSFLKELEDRLDDIFAEEKPKKAEEPAPADASAPVAAGAMDAPAMPAGEGTSAAAISGEDRAGSINDLKNIVLSLEWELNDESLEKFDEEILKLEGVYSEDLIAMAFVRMLRFLGRYIRVKSAESEPRSINLLLSTYDNLEQVLLSRDMTDYEKYSLMAGNISNYRQWVETEDLTAVKTEDSEGVAPEPSAAEPALQVVAGKPEAEDAQPEGPAPDMSQEYSQTAVIAEKFAQAAREEALPGERPSLVVSRPEDGEEASPSAEAHFAVEETELEGEAAQWKKAVEKESVTAAGAVGEEPALEWPPDAQGPSEEAPVDYAAQWKRTVEKESVTDAGPVEEQPVREQTPDVQGAPDEAGTDEAGEKYEIPAQEPQAGEAAMEETAAADVRGIPAEPVETKASEYPERGDALGPDLERIRREIRDEILEELRGEIDSLRDQIRYLAKKINWDEQ